jgi:hypothetical protein
MRRHSRFTLALLVLVLLSASPALPQQGRRVADPSRTMSFGAALRSVLHQFLVRLWEGAGCGVDPYGVCRPAAPAPQPLEPHTSLRAEEGCGVDPFGRCLTSAATPQPPGGH